MAGIECQEQLRKETMEKRLNKRKHTLQSKLMKKRLHPAYETDRQEIENPEEQEVQQEDGEQKGTPQKSQKDIQEKVLVL